MTALRLVLLRHGESEANIAAAEAEHTGADRVAVPARDPDVVLSSTGRDQAVAVGGALAGLPDAERPTAAWVSPYRRAQQTAELALAASGLELPVHVDERLRDRELGVLDTLTSQGVEHLHPEEAERRRFLGKFYYRPPGGESWADLVLRIRAFLADLELRGHGRQLIVSHDAVILLFRYVCEQLDEDALFQIARTGSVTNASVSRLVRQEGEPGWRTAVYNDGRHLEAFGAQATEHPGEIDAAR
jgi:broad specificity phosphatase PhoE